MRLHFIMVLIGTLAMAVVSSFILGPGLTIEIVRKGSVPIIIGIASMFSFGIAISFTYRRRIRTNPLFCSFHGWITFLIGTAVSRTANVIVGENSLYKMDVFSYGVKPFYWLTLMGSAPAFLIGLFTSVLFGDDA